ncbi:MAG: FecR domain-containing protein [Candidatus Omnitrophota bacterium]|nr:FecR domain-containing protein [Candidatus Omnitrophota bacterium]
MKFHQKFVLLVLVAAVTVAAPSLAADIGGDAEQAKSLVDHEAGVFNLGGTVLVLRNNSTDWVPLKIKDAINEGDQIRTQQNSFVEIYYDAYFLNIARMGSNTFAEFRAIEPTDVFLSDGRVLNALDGLPPGSTYEVATPTSVAGVRGTHFIREHDAKINESRTFVTEGSVEHFIFDSAGGLVGSHQVGQDEAFIIDQANIDTGRIEGPREMTEAEKMSAEEEYRFAATELETFAGGAEKITEAHSKFKEVLADGSSSAYIAAAHKDVDNKNHIGNGGPPGGSDPYSHGGSPGKTTHQNSPMSRTVNDRNAPERENQFQEKEFTAHFQEKEFKEQFQEREFEEQFGERFKEEIVNENVIEQAIEEIIPKKTSESEGSPAP